MKDKVHYNAAALGKPKLFVGATHCGRFARCYVQTNRRALVTCRTCRKYAK